MPVNPDFKDLLHLLNNAGVKYLIVGAYAVIHYTEPRYTKDIDFWIATDSENARKTYEVLKEFGAPLDNISPKDLENPDLVYQVGIEPNRIDVLMGIKGLNFSQAWQNREESTYGEEKICLVSLKDLIKAKEASGRPQDKIDLHYLKKVLAGK